MANKFDLNLFPKLIRTYRQLRAHGIDGFSMDKIFTKIFENKGWGNLESVSGSGSRIENTVHLRKHFDRLIKEKSIQSILDIPCGDFNWMKLVISKNSNINYLGADIVSELIAENNRKHEASNIKFTKKDLTKEPLGKHDLIVCRDCLFHFSYYHIAKAIENIKLSDSKYLLTTTFPETRKNKDIITGYWRPINLEISPFCFPKPDLVIRERSSQKFPDKSMGLWQIKNLKYLQF